MLAAAHRFHHRHMISELENQALNVCCRKEERVELQELKVVAELYYIIFCSRWMRGEVESAFSIGFTTLKICHEVRAVPLKLTLLPSLISMLLLGCQYSDVASMLHELGKIIPRSCCSLRKD